MNWPTQSPDFSPPDLWLSGRLKTLMYSDTIADTEVLTATSRDCLSGVSSKSMNVWKITHCLWAERCAAMHGQQSTKGGPKKENIFLEGRGVLLPSAPAWCVYVTALLISWPSGVLEERSIRSVWFFFLNLCHCFCRFFDYRLKRTTCLHPVLFPFGENSSRDCHNASRGF